MKHLCILLIATFAFLLPTSCAQNSAVSNVSVLEFEKAIASDTIQLLDVRTADEYARGYIKHAKNIDQSADNFVENCAALDKNKPVYIYCLSGGRSANAAKRLANAGFVKIVNLDGGVMAWRNEAKSLVVAPRNASTTAATSPGMTMEQFTNLTSTGTVLVEFYATWCGPCKKLKPIVQQIEQEQQGKIKVLYVDVDASPEIATALKLSKIPVVQIYKNGKRTWNNVGMTDKAKILKKLA